jgi:Tfp pilus assembly protein PilE
MIVVAIIGILAVVAIPQYLHYTQRAKQAEGLTMMGTIKTAQHTHYATRDCFVPVRSNPAIMPSTVREPWDQATLLPNGACGDPSDRSFEDISVRPGITQMWYQYNCRVRFYAPGVTDEYTCTAIGDLDGDAQIYELLLGTDHDGDDTCIPSALGTVSNFPWEPIRVSPALF